MQVQDFIAQQLGGVVSNSEFSGLQLETRSGNIEFALREDSDSVHLDNLHALEKGSGLGSEFMLALKAYSDQTGKTLFVNEIENREFFMRFDWLQLDDDGWGVEQGFYMPGRQSSWNERMKFGGGIQPPTKGHADKIRGMLREVQEMYEGGKSVKEIGRELGVAGETVRRVLTDEGNELRPQIPPEAAALQTPEAIAKVKEMYEGGASLRAIGREFNVSYPTIQRLLGQNGVETRKPKGPSQTVPDVNNAVERETEIAGAYPLDDRPRGTEPRSLGTIPIADRTLLPEEPGSAWNEDELNDEDLWPRDWNDRMQRGAKDEVPPLSVQVVDLTGVEDVHGDHSEVFPEEGDWPIWIFDDGKSKTIFIGREKGYHLEMADSIKQMTGMNPDEHPESFRPSRYDLNDSPLEFFRKHNIESDQGDVAVEATAIEKFLSGKGYRPANEFKFGASYVAPSGARSNARRGIELVNQGEAGDGLESATVTRAHSIADGKPLTSDHIQRMHSFFERHDKTRPDDGGKGNSPWKTAWLLWGGDAGRSWANSMYHKINGGSDEKTSGWNEKMHHGRSRNCPPAEYRQWNCPLCGGDSSSHVENEGLFNQRTFEPDEASPVEDPS